MAANSVSKRKYWYILHIYECPICGRGEEYRERVYEKPASYWVHHTSYDWCDVL